MARSQGGAPVSVRLTVVGGDGVKREFDAMGASGRKAFHEIEAAAKRTSPALRAASLTSSELQQGARGIAAEAGVAGRVLSSIGPAGLAAGAGIGAAAIAVTKAMQVARSAVEDFDQLGETIRNLGIDSDLFQGLSFKAGQSGIGEDQFAQAIKTAQLNFGQLELGIGRTAKALTTYDGELAKNLKTAGSFEERLDLIADAMARETDTTQKNVLAKIVFGDANTKMAQVIGDGADAIDRTIAEAKEFGVVVDRSVLERADKIADQMGTAAKVIDLNLKQAFIDLAPVMVGAANVAARVAAEIGNIIDRTRELQDRTREGPLEQDLQTEEKTLEILRKRRAEGQTRVPVPGAMMQDINEVIRRAEARVKALSDRLEELRNPAVDPMKLATENAEQFDRVADAINRTLEGVATKAEKIAAINEGLAKTTAELEAMRGKPGTDSASIDAALARAREAADRQKAALNESGRGGGRTKTDEETERLKRLAKAWIEDVTPAVEQHQKVVDDLNAARERGFINEQQYQKAILAAERELTEEMKRQREEQLERANTLGAGLELGLRDYAEQASKVAEQVADAVGGAFDGMEDALVDFVTTGKASFSDLAQSILADIARIAIRQAILGPIAHGLIGAFTGGAGGSPLGQGGIGSRDQGGSVSPGTLYSIGRGPYQEYFAARSPGAIATANQVAAAMGGGRGKITLNVNVSGARGNAEIEEMAMRGAAQAIAAYDEGFGSRVQWAVAGMMEEPMIRRF